MRRCPPPDQLISLNVTAMSEFSAAAAMAATNQSRPAKRGASKYLATILEKALSLARILPAAGAPFRSGRRWLEQSEPRTGPRMVQVHHRG